MSSVQDQVLSIVRKHCSVPDGEVEQSTPLKDFALDSLALLEIGLDLEREFDVTIDDAELAASTTLDDLVKLVTAVTAGQAV